MLSCAVLTVEKVCSTSKLMAKQRSPNSLNDFLKGKSQHTQDLFACFIQRFEKVGKIEVLPAKTMIGIATPRKRIAYITQLGKDFIHVVFPFPKAYEDNLCFQKIAQVPGDAKQFNHHLRIYTKDDLNDEVMTFMQLAFKEGS
jgi:hypothetical protein